MGRRRTGRGRRRSAVPRSGPTALTSPHATRFRRLAGTEPMFCALESGPAGPPEKAAPRSPSQRRGPTPRGTARRLAATGCAAELRARRGAGTTRPRASPRRRRDRERQRPSRAASGCRPTAATERSGRRRGEHDAARYRRDRPRRRRATGRRPQLAPGDSSPETTCATRRALPPAMRSSGLRSSSASIGFESQTGM